MLRLYTFAISHFSEKARWGLDANGVAYEERVLVPGAHVAVIRRRAPRTTVPVLEGRGETVQGSGAILDFLEARLGATKLAVPARDAARAAEIEALADKAFGLGTQRIFYDALLADRRGVTDLWAQRGPVWARPFITLMWPLIRKGVRRAYAIRPPKVDEAKDLFRRAFDETDRLLAERGGRYLLGGDAPSRVDVTVAALLAPTCRPPEHMLRWPAAMPEALEAFVGELLERPTAAHVRRMYREHRRADPARQPAA